MEYFNKQICVTVEELTSKENGGAIMSLSNYYQLVNRKRITVARKAGGLDNYALIVYTSLPERFRIRFEAKYGKPEEVLKETPLTQELLIDTKARNFYGTHLLPDGQSIPKDKQQEYTINASVLNELISILNQSKGLQKALGGKAGNVWQSILATSESFRDYPGHTLPSNLSRLKQKINEYKKDGYGCLISRKFGNKNTEKITPEAGRQIIALKRARVPKVYNNAQIFEEFNRIAAERGWKPLKSIHTLIQYLNRPEVEPLWWDAVHGELSAKMRYGRKHKTELPQIPDALWYGDGTKLNLYYKDYDAKGSLIIKTTQVYEVMDAYSEVLLGYHISETENFQAQYNAYRMAVETAGCRPYEIVTDNQGGHKKLESMEFFENICKISRFTAPYNPQSKSIEAAFGRFQAQILHQDWRFTGQNITAKRQDSRPNLELIEANKDKLYTYDELLEAYAQARHQWNTAKHPHTGRPRLETYRATINPESEPVTLVEMVDMFWVTTKKASVFTSNGITITVDKKEYTYEVFDSNGIPDLEFRQLNTYRKFYVMYDPMDMTVVRLCVKDKKNGFRYVATAQPYATIHRAIQEQQPGEAAFIKQMEIKQKELRIQHQQMVASLEADHGVALEQHGLARPRLKGISAAAFENTMDKQQKKRKKEQISEPISIGLVTKHLSNQTFDQVAALEKF